LSPADEWTSRLEWPTQADYQVTLRLLHATDFDASEAVFSPNRYTSLPKGTSSRGWGNPAAAVQVVMRMMVRGWCRICRSGSEDYPPVQARNSPVGGCC